MVDRITYSNIQAALVGFTSYRAHKIKAMTAKIFCVSSSFRI